MMALEEGWGTATVIPEPDRRPVPWEDPQLSRWVGFYRTLRDLLFSPGEFFETLGRAGWAEPLAFALIASTVGLLFTFFWHLLILAGGGDTGGAVYSLGLGPAALLGLMVATPILVLVDLGVGCLCWWGSVAVSGADRDFTPAWRIFCYAHGAMVLGVIPILGMLVAGLWFLALLYIGARKVLELSALGSLGSLGVYLAFQALLGIIFLLGLIVCLSGLGFLALLA
ncbi:MAG: hypothetical protein ACOZFS_12315 [Thermodesulfobacteriota bacterium]